MTRPGLTVLLALAWLVKRSSSRTRGGVQETIRAVTSAIGTLKGPLHGGANQKVMEMLEKRRAASRMMEGLGESLS